MRKSRFSEEQIIKILSGKLADVCGRHGISEATSYAWKAIRVRKTGSASRMRARIGYGFAMYSGENGSKVSVSIAPGVLASAMVLYLYRSLPKYRA